MGSVDPITLSVIRNRLVSIANGMLEVAFRCGVTSFMYEIRDCSFGLIDRQGGLIAQSDGIPLFAGSLGPAVRNCIDVLGSESLEEGDIVICNLPSITGNHTCDGILFLPIFYKGRLFAFSAGKTHWIDLGAKGSYPVDARDIFEEGLRIPPVKLYKRGVLDRDVWGLISSNSRAPDLVFGDMQAQISACHLAEAELVNMLEKYGERIVEESIDEIYNHSERVLRSAISSLPDGMWEAEDFLDDLKEPLKMKVLKEGDRIVVDFTGSPPEQPSTLNSLWVTTVSAVRFAVKALFCPELPSNEGFSRPIEVIAPYGSIFNASASVPCFLCGNVAQTIIELMNKALCEVLPERIPACSGADVIGNGFFGVRKDGRYWGTIVPSIIGQGADMRSDGESYLMHPSCGGGKNIPVEILESKYPLFVERVELIPDSGGPGKQRGGLGSLIEVRLLSSARFFCFIEKSKTPHFGLFGGKPGLRNYAVVRSSRKGEFEVLKTSGIELEEGDRVTVVAGGGGGYGDPLERDPEKVLWDVVNGYVSLRAAAEDYTVMIDPCTLRIDWEMTKQRRAEKRRRSTDGACTLGQ